MHKRILFSGIILTALIFAADVTLPARLHLEFIYAVVILLSIWIPGHRSTFDAGIVMTALMIIGFYLNGHQAIGGNEIPTILVPACSLWAFVYVIIRFKMAREKLRKSDEYLNAMFENATEGMIISNTNGEIIMANPHAELMFGYAIKELKGRTIEELVPSRLAARHVSHRNHYDRETMNRSMGKGVTLYGRRKDGEEFPVEICLSKFQILDEAFIISFIIDITERKRQEELVRKANSELELRVAERTAELAEANENLKEEVEERSRMEEALRDSERLYSTMAHNFPNGWIEILDRNLKRVFINGKELQELGIDRKDFQGKTKLEKTLLPMSPEIREKLGLVFEWQSTDFDVEFMSKIYEVNAVPLPDIKGIVKEILLVVQNVTDIRRAEYETREALKKEKQLNDLKSKFVSTASHEFRTPLSTILSSVSLAEKYSAPADEMKRVKHFERIKSSVHNLTEILNDFLSLEKLEAGKIECRPDQFDIVNFAEDMKEQMQTLAKPGQEIIYSHLGPRLVTLDRQLLRNICINLIGNAIKYSPEGKAIEFSTEVDGAVTLSVSDKGIGIPETDQPHLCERFFRAQNVTAIQGTGLGLNIVNRYVRLMNGEMEFTSKENAGSKFTVTFNK